MSSRDDLGRGPRWVILLLFAPLFLIGLMALYRGIGLVFQEGLIAETALALGVGTLFTLVGGGVWYYFLIAEKVERRREARIRGRYPDEPWRWREEWEAGVLEYSDLGRRNFSWFFSIVWLGALSVAAMARGPLMWQERAYAPMGLLAFLFLLGIVVMEQAIAATRRGRIYGRSSLELRSLPARLGESLDAVLHTGMKEPPSSALRLELKGEIVRSVLRQEGDHVSDRRRDEERQVFCERNSQVEVSKLFTGPRGLSAEIALSVPSAEEGGVASTVGRGGEQVTWTLEVRQGCGSDAYFASFQLPVF